MNGSGHKQWIVLLNKIPRGPFTAEEIKDLISKGLLRHNDLVFLIQTESDSSTGAWKFLWQYAEFDSRRKDKEPEATPAVVLEKRHHKSEAQVSEELKELVPLDLQSIRIEDLILKASSGVRKDFSSLKATEDSQRSLSISRVEKVSFSARNLSGVFVLLALIGMGWAGVSKLKSVSPSTSSIEDVPKKSVAEAQAAPAPSKSRTPASSRTLPKPRMPMPNTPPTPSSAPSVVGSPSRPPMPTFIPNNMPRERDRGDIREDEIRRMRAEELRREQEEREQQRRQEAEELRRSEEDESGEASSNKRARPGRPSDRNNTDEPPVEDRPEMEPPPEREPDEPPPASWIE